MVNTRRLEWNFIKYFLQDDTLSDTSIILIVDDQPIGREILHDLLDSPNYHLFFASDGYEALKIASMVLPDLILLDVMMPGMGGFGVCRRLRADPVLAEVPILLLTALDDSSSRIEGIEAGADDCISKPFNGSELRARVKTITRLARYRKLNVERNQLAAAHKQLLTAYDATIEGWARALTLRDMETGEHMQRVTELTIQLAKAFGMSNEEIIQVRRGSLLHDMGKLGIPDAILRKPGKLTDEEFRIMRKHPQYAYDMLYPIEYLRPALDIPYCHHERWDGSGYPRKLKGEEIPLAARIFTVVDVWDALRSDRPYRSAWPEEKSRQYIWNNSGSQFDPRVVELFHDLLDDQAEVVYIREALPV